MSSRSAFCAIGTLPIGNLIFARFTEIRTVSTTLPEEEVRFARDSPLEGRGLEPSVPVRGLAFFGNRPVQPFRRGRLSLLGICHSWSKHSSLVFPNLLPQGFVTILSRRGRSPVHSPDVAADPSRQMPSRLASQP